jgi:hypothetical protein
MFRRKVEDVPMKSKALRTFGLTAALALLTPLAARSTLTMTLSGTPGSSIIDLSFSGSSIGNFSGSYLNFGWHFVPTTFDPFPAAITGNDYGYCNFIRGNRSLTINGAAHSFTGIFLQDSSNSPYVGYERFGGLTPSFSAYPGDVWEWSGTAQIDLAPKGLTFDDLNPGSVTVMGDHTVLEGRLEIVPEPSTCVLLTIPLGFLLIRRLRDHKRR